MLRCMARSAEYYWLEIAEVRSVCSREKRLWKRRFRGVVWLLRGDVSQVTDMSVWQLCLTDYGSLSGMTKGVQGLCDSDCSDTKAVGNTNESHCVRGGYTSARCALTVTRRCQSSDWHVSLAAMFNRLRVTEWHDERSARFVWFRLFWHKGSRPADEQNRR
jgi:hypothetical protein